MSLNIEPPLPRLVHPLHKPPHQLVPRLRRGSSYVVSAALVGRHVPECGWEGQRSELLLLGLAMNALVVAVYGFLAMMIRPWYK